MKSNKKYFFIVNAVLITTLLIFEIAPPYKDMHLIFIKLFTYHLLLIALYFYTFYTIKSNKRRIIAAILTFVLYLVNFYVIFNIYLLVKDVKIGVYLFGISFILFIISLFIKEEKEDPNKKEIETMNKNVNNYFIIGEYVTGIKADIKTKLCSLTNMENNQGIKILFPNNDNVISYDFLKTDINSITVSRRTILSETQNINKNDADSRLLVAALFGIYGTFLAQSGIFKSVDDYNKVNIKDIYQIEINYYYNKEENKKGTIIINTKESPKTFFSNYSDIYIEK